MKAAFRRIVTGVNDAGKSRIHADSDLPETATGAIEVWRDRREPAAQAADGVNLPYRFYPPPGESLARIVHFPPFAAAVSLAELTLAADEFFTSLDIADCRIDTQRHPFMHRTPTLDYVMLLAGSLTMLVDVGEPVVLEPMDMVVQRMTNHTWINTGTEPAALLVVMIGRSHEHD